MTFTTLTYIVFFLIVLILYYELPKRTQWIVLLIASYIFYAFASRKWLLVLICVTFISYGCAYKIGQIGTQCNSYLSENKNSLSKEAKKGYRVGVEAKKKRWLAICIVLELLVLLLFKYLDFFFGGISFLPNSIRDTFDTIILPVGLSFYMFQSIGYCIDVYREVYEPEKNFAKYALFVSFFPQLLQGPIGDFSKLESQLVAQRDFNYNEVKHGLQRATWGFFKKLVIANQISVAIADVWVNYENYAGIIIFATLILYSIQLYADFSGYMDIAIGCAQSLGINLDENFTTPYFSKNISEFWRNWHITLGSWFKKYLFYSLLLSKPLAKIRKKHLKSNPYIANTFPNVIALTITWVSIGLWHGASWHFVLYGIYHGLFIVLAALMEPQYARFRDEHQQLSSSTTFALFQMLRTFLIVTMGYAIFVSASVSDAVGMLRAMLSDVGIMTFLRFVHQEFTELAIAFAGSIVLLIVDIFHYQNPTSSIRNAINSQKAIVRWSIYILAIASIVILGEYGSPAVSGFAYFGF